MPISGAEDRFPLSADFPAGRRGLRLLAGGRGIGGGRGSVFVRRIFLRETELIIHRLGYLLHVSMYYQLNQKAGTVGKRRATKFLLLKSEAGVNFLVIRPFSRCG